MVDAVDFVHFPPTKFDTAYGCDVSPIVDGSTVAQIGLLTADIILNVGAILAAAGDVEIVSVNANASRRNTAVVILVENMSTFVIMSSSSPQEVAVVVRRSSVRVCLLLKLYLPYDTKRGSPKSWKPTLLVSMLSNIESNWGEFF